MSESVVNISASTKERNEMGWRAKYVDESCLKGDTHEHLVRDGEEVGGGERH